ncbi:MAG: hypothetical protein AAFU73_00175 [Planctomycetota bacterium]
MLKAIGAIQLVLAPIFVVPAVTRQDGTGGIDTQLDATLRSLEYVAGLRNGVRAGDAQALRALDRATEPPRDASSPQRSAHLQALQDDIAELRYSLDRLLADSTEVDAIMAMPPSVLDALGLSGRPRVAIDAAPEGTVPPGAPVATGPATGAPEDTNAPSTGAAAPNAATPGSGAPTVGTTNAVPQATGRVPSTSLAGVSPTTGLDSAMHRALEGDVGPLDEVSPQSRRRGNEPAPLEGEGFVADPVRLGRLLVRSKRTSEAIELLEGRTDSLGARYWLARAYAEQQRLDEALEHFRELSTNPDGGIYARHAAQDLEFLEFKRSLEARLGDR